MIQVHLDCSYLMDNIMTFYFSLGFTHSNILKALSVRQCDCDYKHKDYDVYIGKKKKTVCFGGASEVMYVSIGWKYRALGGRERKLYFQGT